MDVQSDRKYNGLGGRASRLRDQFSNLAGFRTAELAKTKKDMHNSTFSPLARTA
jgi:hypothetical protein